MALPDLLLDLRDARQQAALASYLSGFGWRTRSLDGDEPLQADILLVDLAGSDVGPAVSRWRARCDAPMMVLLGQEGPADRVLALRAGADDCLSEPYDRRELVARLLVLHRRMVRACVEAVPQWRLGSWLYDSDRRCLLDADGQAQQLPPAEAELLALLLSRPRQVCAREWLRQRLRDRTLEQTPARAPGPDDRRVDLLVSSLRRRMTGADACGSGPIQTVRGVGYRLDARQEPR